MNNSNLPHIAHVVSYFPPHLGGMENCAYEIVKQLKRNKYDYSVFTSNIDTKKKIRDLSSVYYLSSVEFAHTPIFPELYSRLMKLPKNSVIHLHISQAFSPEIVLFVSKLRAIPYVAHFHLDVDSSGPFGFLLEPYKNIFLKRVLNNAARVIALTEEQKREIHEKYGVSFKKITVIPNGVGNEYFSTRKGISSKLAHLLFVGRLASQKNLPFLIDSVSQVKHDVVLDIVGEGEEREELEKIIKEKKLRNIFLHGRKTSKDLVRFYKSADIFVLTSRKEGLSLSALEAAASGLPIVNLDNPGISSFTFDIGVIVKKQDSKTFAQAIDRLLSDEIKVNALSKKAQLKAKDYSWENVFIKLAKAYKEVARD